MQEAPAYEIRGRTMSIEEWELNVQVESPVDFISLVHHGCELRDIYHAQDLDDYFGMLNGPTYMNLVRHFWVRAQVYHWKAAQLEMDEKVLIDPSLQGKTREEMGLEPFTCTEIRSSIMGIPVFISEVVISWVIRRAFEGRFVSGLDNSKSSPWNDIVNKTMFSSTRNKKYSDLSMKHKQLLKIQNENLLPKGGGEDQPSLDHRVFLHFFMIKEKSNVPKYIFRHMIKTLRESQTIKRSWIPYGRLISEILHQGGILNTLKEVNIITDARLGTVIGNVINGGTLKHMKLIKKEGYTVLSTDLKEFAVVSNLMDDFPPICKQDPLDVRVHYILDHFEKTSQTSKLNDIPNTMYGGALPIAKSMKSNKRAISEAEYVEETPEPAPKKAKKSKVAPQEQLAGPDVLSIQQEVQDLDATEVLNERTRSGKPVESSQSLLPQSSIPKKKRKLAVKKLREASLAEEEQEEAATTLVARELIRKRAAEEAAMKKALVIVVEIAVPFEVLMKESSAEAAQKVVELTENLQQMVKTSDVLKADEDI